MCENVIIQILLYICIEQFKNIYMVVVVSGAEHADNIYILAFPYLFRNEQINVCCVCVGICKYVHLIWLR